MENIPYQTEGTAKRGDKWQQLPKHMFKIQNRF